MSTTGDTSNDPAGVPAVGCACAHCGRLLTVPFRDYEPGARYFCNHSCTVRHLDGLVRPWHRPVEGQTLGNSVVRLTDKKGPEALPAPWLRLAADLLDRAAGEFSAMTCDAWDWPDWAEGPGGLDAEGRRLLCTELLADDRGKRPVDLTSDELDEAADMVEHGAPAHRLMAFMASRLRRAADESTKREGGRG